MTRTLIAAAFALMATAAHASSKPTLPKEFHGTWCPADGHFYERVTPRKECSNDGDIAINATGFSSGEETKRRCTLQAIAPYGHDSNAYQAAFKCKGEGQTYDTYFWIERMGSRLAIDHDEDGTFGKPWNGILR